MKNHYILREETIQPEFDVRITPNVNRYLYIIKVCNRFYKDGIMRFIESLERIQKDLSYRKNGLECVNGMPMRAYGLSVYYMFQNDVNSGEPHVTIYRIVVDFNYFNLVNPATFRRQIKENTNKVAIKESQLRSIIRKTIKRVLLTS